MTDRLAARVRRSTPAGEIVAELDRYVVGQAPANARCVAIRNRWRRQHLPPDLARRT